MHTPSPRGLISSVVAGLCVCRFLTRCCGQSSVLCAHLLRHPFMAFMLVQILPDSALSSCHFSKVCAKDTGEHYEGLLLHLIACFKVARPTPSKQMYTRVRRRKSTGPLLRKNPQVGSPNDASRLTLVPASPMSSCQKAPGRSPRPREAPRGRAAPMDDSGKRYSKY
jgi:hypothetical protein